MKVCLALRQILQNEVFLLQSNIIVPTSRQESFQFVPKWHSIFSCSNFFQACFDEWAFLALTSSLLDPFSFIGIIRTCTSSIHNKSSNQIPHQVSQLSYKILIVLPYIKPWAKMNATQIHCKDFAKNGEEKRMGKNLSWGFKG